MGQCNPSKFGGTSEDKPPEAQLGMWAPLLVKSENHKAQTLVMGGDIPPAGKFDQVAAGGKFVTVGPSDRAIWFRINGGHDVLPKYVLQSMEDTGGSMHVDKFQEGGALIMTTQPMLGDVSYFRFNTAPGDGTVSPDGHPQLVLGVRELGVSRGGSTVANTDDSAPRSDFEKLLKEQAPEQFQEMKMKKKLNSARGEDKFKRLSSIRDVLDQKMPGAKSVCLVRKGDPDQLHFYMGTACAMETGELKALFNNMQAKVKSKFEAKENDELVAWEKQELTKFRREKAKFGADYLEGPKNKARLARMLELERKYPDHGAITEQRSNVINAPL